MSRSADRDSYPKLKREITIFLVFLGVLVGAAGILALTGLRDNPRQLWGLDRHIAIGLPTLTIGLLHVVSGVGLGVTSKKLFAILGAAAGTVLALFYFVFMASATGRLPANLMSLVVAAIPILLWMRVSTFLNTTISEQGVDDPSAAGADSKP